VTVMLSQSLLKKIRHIELHTKRILSGCLVGDYRTSHKGFGLEFEQLAEYQFGDDIRFIDWKSSARMNKMLIKEYRDEQNRTIFLLVDGSQSTAFGSSEMIKKDIITEIASILALAAVYGKDHVGLIVFTDEVELFIPPKGGFKHAHTIMQELFNFQPKSKGTRLESALERLACLKKRNSLVFLISDFIDETWSKGLRITAKKHDIVAIRCIDQLEKKFPHIGFIQCQDLENGQDIVLDATSLACSSWQKTRLDDQNYLFNICKVDHIDVVSGKPFIEEVILFLRRRI
jgi:uncharacterized protein (DUF58 family)